MEKVESSSEAPNLARGGRAEYRWLPLAGLMVAILGLFVGVGLWPSNPPAVVIFPENAPWTYKERVPDRWIPGTWGWYWRGKEFIFGKRRSVLISASIWKIQGNVELASPKVSLPQPVYVHTNGVRIWVLGEAEFAGFGSFLKSAQEQSGGVLISSPRISTADGIQARLHIGQAAVGSTAPGVVLDVLSVPRSGGTDQKATVIVSQLAEGSSSLVITNLFLSGRFQIPKGGALLFLKPGEAEKKLDMVAVTIHPAWK